jgi:disulfide bond formation protein DsbB
VSRVAAITFLLGVALMLAFDEPITRIAGVLLLLAGLGIGVFAIATPEFTEGSDPSNGLERQKR